MSILDQRWCEEHAEAGDRILALADEAIEFMETQATMPAAAGLIAAYAAVAQAHYAAANVRAKPIVPAVPDYG